MLAEPCWIDVQGVVHLNKRIVAATGEPHLLVSKPLLESGCERAKNHWHYDGVTDVADLATSVLFGIARNHPFAQGNKRTAFYAMVGFLGANSFRFTLEDDVRIANDVIAILDGKLGEETFAPKLRRVIEFVEKGVWS